MFLEVALIKSSIATVSMAALGGSLDDNFIMFLLVSLQPFLRLGFMRTEITWKHLPWLLILGTSALLDVKGQISCLIAIGTLGAVSLVMLPNMILEVEVTSNLCGANFTNEPLAIMDPSFMISVYFLTFTNC